VPVYNRAPHISADIERALDQDFTESNSSSLGIPCSRKRSLELARAPYKAWLDSDDRMAQRLLWQHFVRQQRDAQIAVIVAAARVATSSR
jgi:glycosyltransferase involved in cell wall biosynthesis